MSRHDGNAADRSAHALSPTVRLRRWLAHAVAHGRPGEPLPTEKQLVESFGVSRSTVRRLLSAYVDEGSVCRIRGRGSFLAPVPAVSPPAPGRSAKQRLTEELTGLIAAGTLRRGDPLPPVKFMTARFGVTQATVTGAYRALVRAGHACRVGKRYWVGRFVSLLRHPTRRELLFFVWSALPEPSLFDRDHLERSYVKMETELQAHGFRLRHTPRDEFEEIARAIATRHRRPHGFIFYNVWKESECEQIIAALREAFHAIREPIPPVMIVSVGMRNPDPRIAFVHLGNILTAQARTAASFLAEQGAADVVLFRHRALHEPGLVYERIYPELRRLDRRCRFTIVVQVPGGPEEHGRFRANLHTEPTASRLRSMLGQDAPMTTEQIASFYEPVSAFEEAYERHAGKRTWLFPSSAMAAHALDWLERHGIAVPDTTQLVALDNDPRFHARGITSCLPDWEGIGYLMAHALIRDFPIERTRLGYIRMRALLLERETTMSGI
jgi:DNA-binding transcriptional regulator YhcF (GntR family)/DNA-binding LacI/PurR family transcriptional regulator